MCCFSGPVHVEGTKIFARTDARGWQGIVYEMKYTSRAPVAMVLPIPYAPAIGKENGGVPVRFVDFSEYTGFFDSLGNGFPTDGGEDDLFADDDNGRGPPLGNLAVEEVGDYVASFVPSVKDFARLDARFRMKDDVWRALPKYRDYGFAVFQLAAHADGGQVHPMAFVFRSRQPTSTFFPTVHVHDGTVPRTAAFDHMLYLQTRQTPPSHWEQSDGPAERFVDLERAQRFVRPRRVYRNAVHGEQKNDDIWLNP